MQINGAFTVAFLLKALYYSCFLLKYHFSSIIVVIIIITIIIINIKYYKGEFVS